MFNFRGPTGVLADLDVELLPWGAEPYAEMTGPDERGAVIHIPLPLPGPETVNNDDATELLLLNPTKTRAAAESVFGPAAILNPETAMNAAVAEVADSVIGGAASLLKVVNAVGEPGTPRPAWAGVVLWLVDLGELEPAHFQPGDIIAQATETGWTPAWGVDDMAAWFDASTIPAGSLTRWDNKAGPADFEAPSSAPTVVAGKINGRPAVVSDGTSSYMEMVLATPYTGTVSVFAVGGTDTADNPAGTDFLWNAASGSGTDQRASLARDTDEAYVANRNVGFTLNSANGAFTAGVHVIEARYEGAASYVHVDGSVVASGNLGASVPEIAKWGILARNDTAGFDAFFIGEMIIVHGDVTAATRTRILTYLTDKWVP